MKLLIVDDEELTRNGLINSISWEKLGVTEILQADDGINGLSLALKYNPELILCDVRMPRMDGIQMVENLQLYNPDTVIIFMSGYSDKEYLKAAIKLKAVNYVEKPLNPTEIQKAILEGIQRYHENQRTLRSETYEILERSSRLALYLTFPYGKKKEQISELLSLLPFKLPESSYLTTFIVKGSKGEVPDQEQNRAIPMNFYSFLKPYHLYPLYVCKHQKYLVFHIVGETKPSKLVFDKIIDFLQSHIMIYEKCFICQGDTVSDVSKTYLSYESAVLLMESSFFFDTDQVLTSELFSLKNDNRTFSSFSSNNYIEEFSEAILLKDLERSLFILKQLYLFFFQNKNVLSGQVKDIYYKLFALLQDGYHKMKISDKGHLDLGVETLINYLEQFYSYQILHETLVEKTKSYFHELEGQTEENSTIFLIKDYINKNYNNESLSVKDISNHVYLSTSYVCTLFKTETGKTLNQYITEFRIEKAKKLLQDPRHKISDISFKLGYSDGNYFGKTFKKIVGLSPSEYRENMTT